MKRTVIVVACLFLCPKSYSQSLNFKDLLNLYSKQDVKAFLTSRGFSAIQRDATHIAYTKNLGTKTAERVVCNKNAISYTTISTAFIQTIMSQISKQFVLTSKDIQTTDTFYRYKRSELQVMIDVTKTPAVFNSISIGKMH